MPPEAKKSAKQNWRSGKNTTVFMKNKLKYFALPIMGFALLAAGTASAHGWMFGSSATPEEAAKRQTQMFEQQASLLGLSVDEMKHYWAQGKTLPEIAKEKGISEEQLKVKMQEQMKLKMQEHLNSLVQQGVITQAQADQRMQFMQSNLQAGGKMMMKRVGRGMHF